MKPDTIVPGRDGKWKFPRRNRFGRGLARLRRQRIAPRHRLAAQLRLYFLVGCSVRSANSVILPGGASAASARRMLTAAGCLPFGQWLGFRRAPQAKVT